MSDVFIGSSYSGAAVRCKPRFRTSACFPCSVALLLWAGPAVADGPFCRVVVPAQAPALVRQAGSELSCYLSRLTSGQIPVVEAVPGDSAAIVLRVQPTAPLGDEEYVIGPTGGARKPALEIRGRTSLAVLHGAYRLLQEYGIGFYFDGDAVPSQPPARFLLPRIHGKPVFAIRGSLPWYNFLDSPTTWDDQDFRFFADQIVRSGQNFIGFHTYDGEPFAAYEEGGKLVGGEPLLTTEQGIWGTHPLGVDEFGFGTGQLFPGRFWGSDAARQKGTRERRIAAQKRLLARGLSYASARGIRTCLGFEVSGDPTDLQEQKRFVARLKQVLVDYPMLTYVWLWQPEARSMEGTEPPAPRSQGGALYREWQGAFSYIDKPARMWEGMRVAGYGRLAQRVIDTFCPSVRLVLSGWGGDHWLHVSDFFPAWDRVLDKRIIFAALDDIQVGPQVSANYKLPPRRERWAIPWYEFDGDQWFSQANAHVFAKTARDARAKGCQGMLAIHWRTKEVSESQALVARYAWRPDETLDAFYRDYGVRRFGGANGPAIGKALQELDALGYRWLGGPGQSECGGFAWCHVPDSTRESKLQALRTRFAALRALMTKGSPSGAIGRLDDTIASIDRLLLFNRFAGLLVEGGPVDRALAMSAAEPSRAEECGRLLRELSGPDFARMLALWAQTITSRGELGVLATINGKAYFSYREKVARLREACGQGHELSDLARAPGEFRGIVSDFQQTSVRAGQPLVVRCAAWSGADPAKSVVLQYSAAEDQVWRDLPMRRLERCVFQATIPAAVVSPGWVRYRIAAHIGDGETRWPQIRGEPYRQVHVFADRVMQARGNVLTTHDAASRRGLRIACDPTHDGTVRLSWAGVGPEEAVVERRVGSGGAWVLLGSTLADRWEDASVPASTRVEYRIRAPGGSSGVALTLVPAAAAPTSPANLVASARGSHVRLAWTGAGIGDLSVSHYAVERAASSSGPFERVSPAEGIESSGSGLALFLDHPRPGESAYYRVTAFGRAPGTAAVSGVVRAEALASAPAPLLNLDFGSESVVGPTGPVSFTGPHSIGQIGGCGALTTDGGLVVPYGRPIGVDGPFTVAIRFRQARSSQMPVLVSQGAWQESGYFVQLLGGQLRFYVSGVGCLDRPIAVRLGEWHTVVCVYDGVSLATYVDGSLLGELVASGVFRPSERPFTVARYCNEGAEYTLHGDVDFVRLYRGALEPSLISPSK